MIRSHQINNYLGKEFLKIIFNTSLIFFSVGFVMTLFEEINFFKELQVNIYTPIILSLLFTPSLLHNFFPFIILISGIWFFLKIKKSDELTAINVSGMSNLSIIMVPGLLSVILGIIFIAAINPVTSVLVTKYEKIKGNYELDQEYLAVVTVNGIWIKEKNIQTNNIIRATYFKNQSLKEVSIYEFDKNNNFLRRIEAESANISSKKWSLKNVKIISADSLEISKKIENISYISVYDVEKIKSLYSNLDTISFWKLESEIKLLEQRGYSTKKIETKMHKSLAFPFFLLSMLLLSSFFTLGTKLSENNWTYVFIAIISSVIIFFFNDFSAVLGKTERLPVEVSVWMPIAIIFIFSFVGVIHANQK
mgnify:CR=1 FL=1|jgi:lipopolysaccharide export system permease protein